MMDILKRIDQAQQFCKFYADGAYSLETAQWNHLEPPQQQAEPNRWVIQKVGDKLRLNGEEVDPGTIELRLDGLTYRSAEKVEVKQQDDPAKIKQKNNT